jgi:hypothetical protein
MDPDEKFVSKFELKIIKSEKKCVKKFVVLVPKTKKKYCRPINRCPTH